MRGGRRGFGAAAAVMALALAEPSPAQVHVEYVAHACFVVESLGGTRVVIDPYEPRRWIGYGFPAGVEADIVLVTHPHYDHDADYNFPTDVPVLREPGSYAIGDVTITGVEGRHAEPYGKEFGQTNTIWVVETGGVRLAHLGDNGPLGDETLAALGRVDVLMVPVDDDQHILKNAEVAAIRAALKPLLTLPMHYRLTALSDLPESLGPIDEWLAGQDGVTHLPSHRSRLHPSADDAPRVLVFPPSPAVKPWPADLRQAWELLGDVREAVQATGPAPELLEPLERAQRLAPGAVAFVHAWARLAHALGRGGEAVPRLERALAAGTADDRQYRTLARQLLAELYAAAGRRAEAAAQYREILREANLLEPREAARRFLEDRQP